MSVPRVVFDILALAVGVFWRRYGKNNYNKWHEGVGQFIAVIAAIFLVWDALTFLSPRTLRAAQQYFHKHVHVPPR